MNDLVYPDITSRELPLAHLTLACACAARVTVVGSVCPFQNLTNRPTNDTTYLTGNEGQNKLCSFL